MGLLQLDFSYFYWGNFFLDIVFNLDNVMYVYLGFFICTMLEQFFTCLINININIVVTIIIVDQ